MGYFQRYDTYFSDSTGEWKETIGFCESGTCEFCDAYVADGRPANAFVAPQEKKDLFPWQE